MSALKEPPPLVWEENGKLKFRKNNYPTHPDILAALKSKPLDAEAFKRFTAKLGDRKERRGNVTGKVTLFLPPGHNERLPFIDPTPREWRHVSIEAAGDAFDLVSMGARMPFLPGARKFYGVEDSLVTTGLKMEQAVANGRRLEALIKLKQ